MTPILLISGAGLPSWIWDEVRSGLPVETRVAERPAAGDADLSAYVDSALATAAGWDEFAVVAHSVGGVIASALVARAPEPVRGFVGVSACLPQPGQSFLAAQPFLQRTLVSLLMRAFGTRPPAREIRDGLAAGLPAEQAERIVAEFVPESARLYRDPVPEGRFPASTAYVVTGRDTQFTTAQQEQYAAHLGGRVERIDTGHLPMLERPTELTRLLQQVLQPS